ncbi:MAG: ParB/RepB/Spo0J family partition protein [Roseiflexus sp.]|nr:ParB/RepB/Spo0J family partition protein [Roseiflexus sp.]MCS7289062.1 ParB/RepB/Spo0J family partition protein [Roseiflexus sp.]MDW8148407.1 ParB/RepB/Spo0J family partition protein [Roseiflexaceae bacterium]MDW8232696.1 ParB/RepB/Spo0J family partition protein [Roseiflexaceae bacterium]
MQLLWIDPRALEPDPQGVREDPGEIDGLAATIAEYGLLQPLGVVDIGRGRYRVVYGNRRRLAALKLGLERVPCVLLDPDDPRVFLRQLTENLQRRDLNDLEQARAFQKLRDQIALERGIEDEGALDEATARLVGLSPRTVRRYLGLLDLPLEIQEYLRTGELNVTQAQHLRRVPNERTQIELARAAVEEGMSAAEISRLASFFAANPNLSLDDALHALQQGVDLAATASRGASSVAAASAGSPLKGAVLGNLPDDDSDADLWDDETAGNDPAFPDIADETIENQPKNKARVFRIRSLDQMIDETDRLFRAYAEGDLARWVRQDQNAPMKIGLLLRQLEALSRALREIARQQNWVFEDA